MRSQISLIILAAAACLPMRSASAQDAESPAETLAKRIAQLVEATTPPEHPDRGRRQSSAVQVGLGNTALQTSSLDTGSGLQSSARGRTPEDEWRRMFPAKKQKQ